MSSTNLKYTQSLTRMANNTEKLITLGNLKAYNYKLIHQLGLQQNDGTYSYEKTDLTKPSDLIKTGLNPNIATNVKAALDQLYDLVSAGAGLASVASGKSTDATDATEVTFVKDNTASNSENYYINFTDANGKVTNVKLDASSFVKDGVVSSSGIVFVEAGSTWVSEQKNVAADAVLPTGYVTIKDTGKTYDTVLEIDIKDAVNPDANQTYTRLFVNISDVLKDLVGGDGIDINGDTIKVDLATAQDDYVSLEFTEDGKKLVAKTDAGTITYNAKRFTSDATTDNKKVADVANVTSVLNILQDQIDSLTGGTHEAGENVSEAPDAGTNKKVSANGGTYIKTATTDGVTTITVGAIVATDTEVEEIFFNKGLE